MKIKAKNSDLIRWLQPSFIVSDLGVQKDYPDIGNITINVTDNGLYSVANNGNAAIETAPEADNIQIIDKGSVTLKSSHLNDALRSFPDSENIFLELNQTEFSIFLEKDNDEKFSIPVQGRPVSMPAKSDKFDKEAKIKKDIFLRMMNKVVFAMGYEDRRLEFNYWIIRLKSNKARAACGDGRRFSVYDIKGNGLFDSNKNIDILIHRFHNPIIEKLLPLSLSDNVHIQEYAKSDDNDPYLNQTIFNLGNFTLILLGHDPGVKWADEDVFLKRESKHFYTTKVSDWDGPLKSIKATMTKEVAKQNIKHWTQLSFDPSESIINANTSVYSKANRKVKLLDGDQKLNFKLLSKYLIEVIDFAQDSQNIQFEFIDENSPAVVRCYAGEKASKSELESFNMSSGIKESHAFFFAQFSKT